MATGEKLTSAEQVAAGAMAAAGSIPVGRLIAETRSINPPKA
ncbi:MULTISPECIES: pre-toxin TG domain-containing protein [Bacillus]|uniref:Pre-toxin TG domain-containing protein n=1 Tax=Bacillus capparidis TaxID=1840411 RepID=A0ABS4CXY9_9BACI|nr:MULTISPECIES: pre-toxin TG domain-containing protein [Bacillus]MBP1082230.1 hypothetical protein [Bacillus capparidis]MED1096842.1 pre-toxin TG domain-containing protein [Bacillus capparidis]